MRYYINSGGMDQEIQNILAKLLGIKWTSNNIATDYSMPGICRFHPIHKRWIDEAKSCGVKDLAAVEHKASETCGGRFAFILPGFLGTKEAQAFVLQTEAGLEQDLINVMTAAIGPWVIDAIHEEDRDKAKEILARITPTAFTTDLVMNIFCAHNSEKGKHFSIIMPQFINGWAELIQDIKDVDEFLDFVQERKLYEYEAVGEVVMTTLAQIQARINEPKSIEANNTEKAGFNCRVFQIKSAMTPSAH